MPIVMLFFGFTWREVTILGGLLPTSCRQNLGFGFLHLKTPVLLAGRQKTTARMAASRRQIFATLTLLLPDLLKTSAKKSS